MGVVLGQSITPFSQTSVRPQGKNLRQGRHNYKERAIEQALDGLELAPLPLCLKALQVRLLAVALMLRVAGSPGVEG
jgi:hypothetical protein